MIIEILKKNRKKYKYWAYLLIIPIITLTTIVLFNIIPDTKAYTEYGTIVAIYPEPYYKKGDTTTHNVLIVFPSNDSRENIKIKEDDIEKYELNNKILVHKEKSVNIFILIITFFTSMFGTIWIFALIIDLIDHIFRNYKLKLIFISNANYKIRKELDPYGEEDWDN